MSKLPSYETLLKRERKLTRALKARIEELKTGNVALEKELERTRVMLTSACADIAEWRNRFDTLVSRLPSLSHLPTIRDPRLTRCIELLAADPVNNYVKAVKLYRELFGTLLHEANAALSPERDRLLAEKDKT